MIAKSCLSSAPAPPSCSGLPTTFFLRHPYHHGRRPTAYSPPEHHYGLAISNAKTRRGVIFLLVFPFFALPPPASRAVDEEEEEDRLELYVDAAEGFAVLHPSSWPKVDKAGATALFEDRKGKGNNIGVVVNSVRLESLRDFGTPQFVAEKLIRAEKRKESTKDAQVIKAVERLGHEALPVYEFEYTVDSTRGGMKRIFSAAIVMSKKLYLLNIAHSDRLDSPLDGQTRTILEQVLHSFDILPEL